MQLALFIALSLASTGEPVKVATKVRGSIEASLNRQAPRAGSALAAQVARLIRWQGDVIKDVHPNDKISLLYERGDPAELVAVHYKGAAIELAAYRFADENGVQRFYDAEGNLVEPHLRDTPTDYVQITEVVQKGRGKRRHHGLDLKAPEGTDIHVPFEAVVTRINWSTRTNGNCVEVRFTSDAHTGTRARFLHLLEVDSALKRGATVAAGTRLGAVGNTGRSSAPHLHYELRDRAGRVLDPLKTHGTEVVQVSPERAAAFAEQRARFAARLGPAPLQN